jgi:DNA-binding transcriptional LysR family regulator
MKPPRTRRKRLTGRLRLSQLELLAAMDHAQTLSAAAREVNLTQPAASRLLRELSSDLKVVLFERIGRTLQPTAAGRALIRKSVGLIAEIDRTEQEIAAIDGGLMGTAAVGAGVSSCYVIVPQALTLLMRQSPQIAVSVREGPMDELLARLRAGQIDLLVGRFTPDQDMSGIRSHDLYRPNVVAVCGVRNPLAARRSLRWDDLFGEPWIVPEAGTAMRSAVEAHFRKHKRRPIRPLIESSSIQANVALIGGSNLIWVVSSDVARYFAAMNALHILKVPELAAPGAFVMAVRNNRILSPAAQRLAECLRAAARRVSAHNSVP